VVIAPPEGLGATRETLAATAASRMMTLPYDGLDGATHTPPPRLTMGYPLDVLDSDTDIAPAPPGISDSWDDLVTGDAGEEHQSGVRLRVGQLSAEWYDLVGANVA